MKNAKTLRLKVHKRTLDYDRLNFPDTNTLPWGHMYKQHANILLEYNILSILCGVIAPLNYLHELDFIRILSKLFCKRGTFLTYEFC